MSDEAMKTRGPTRPAEARLAEVKRKLARIERGLSEADRKQEARRNILTGLAAMNYADAHPEFAHLLAAALKDFCTSERDLASIEPRLQQLGETAKANPSEKLDGGKRKRFGLF